jgi:hypothetical protein
MFVVDHLDDLHHDVGQRRQVAGLSDTGAYASLALLRVERGLTHCGR